MAASPSENKSILSDTTLITWVSQPSEFEINAVFLRLERMLINYTLKCEKSIALHFALNPFFFTG
jgi:hypothetical protein